jgi:hypothetical protein
MPYLATLTIKISRKFQLGKDDWLGVDALATIAVEEGEAHLVDPADVRRMARQQAKAVVMEQIAEELAERDARRAERAAQRQRAAAPPTVDAPAQNGHRPPPQDAAEAEQRFFARYGQIIGGDDWAATQRYLRSRAPKPATIEGWISTAEAVRDRQAAT